MISGMTVRTGIHPSLPSRFPRIEVCRPSTRWRPKGLQMTEDLCICVSI